MLLQRLPRLALSCHRPLHHRVFFFPPSPHFSPSPLSLRLLSTSHAPQQSEPVQPPPVKTVLLQPPTIDAYSAPLTGTFRRLKMFSLASLGLSTTLAPFMFLVEANLPHTARLALAATALGTSSVGTMLIAWVTRPYVVRMRRLTELHGGENEGLGKGIEVKTLDVFLRTRLTQLYDPDFLVETERPFATFELAREVLLPEGTERPEPGTQETVAQTTDKDGNVLGSWIVTWGENGEGRCEPVGKVLRYFSIHMELLDVDYHMRSNAEDAKS